MIVGVIPAGDWEERVFITIIMVQNLYEFDRKHLIRSLERIFRPRQERSTTIMTYCT